jgi:5-formyltetrahydrofolate cyclo-ligase
MEKESTFQEFQKLILECDGSISYVPMRDEINYVTDPSFPLKILVNNFVLPNSQNSDPFEWANTCINMFQNKQVSILIPGTQFDIHGTRYGKGGGWYDRFVSVVPREWIRIGVANMSQMSKVKLVRQKWDEPMDWLVIKKHDTWEVYRV